MRSNLLGFNSRPKERRLNTGSVLKLYRYGSFWLIKPKACTNQKVVRDTSCLTEIKASRSAFLVAKSAKSAKYRVFCGYTWGKTRVYPGNTRTFAWFRPRDHTDSRYNY